MGKRKQIKDGDVEMGGTDPKVEGDESSDEVRKSNQPHSPDSSIEHLNQLNCARTNSKRRIWTW
jgi:hypothetical protein